jgi:protein O-GlcNAc transferase
LNTATQAALDQANHASALAQAGQVDAAIQAFEAAIALQPSMVGARCNLGALLDQTGRSEAALVQLRKCLQLQPDLPEAWNNYGNALLHCCQIEAAHHAFSRATQLRSSYLDAHSNRILATLYRADNNQTIQLARSDWQRALQAATQKMPAFHASKRSPQQKIRLGFVSPDFRLHSVAYFLQPVLEALCPETFEFYLYSDTQRSDAITLRFKQLADVWLDCQSLSHQQLTELIRADHIDVLFDLCGHFSHNRLPVFAARAANTQAAWLGFPGPTATANIDYYIGDNTVFRDAAHFPADDARLLQLPRGFHCYRPPATAPAIVSPPKETTHRFSFGCFNNTFKISPQIAELWGQLLRATPHSRLVLKARGFSNASVRQQIQHWICRDRIDPSRIVLLARTASLVEHLQCYGSIDLALDTFPYNGTTTTCEALWMGVPTISLVGQAPQSRVGASLLKQAQLEHFIAPTPSAYVAIARALYDRPDYLTRLRASLRTHLAQTDLLTVKSLSQPLTATLIEWANRHAVN